MEKYRAHFLLQHLNGIIPNKISLLPPPYHHYRYRSLIDNSNLILSEICYRLLSDCDAPHSHQGLAASDLLHEATMTIISAPIKYSALSGFVASRHKGSPIVHPSYMALQLQ